MQIRDEKKRFSNYIRAAIGSGFGLGLSPIFPGTCGALCGVLIHVLIVRLLPDDMHLPALLIAFVMVCAANHVLTPWAETFWNSKDPKQFILDEIAGYLFVPILFRHGQLWKVVLWGFILFRILDITKLAPPAKYIDRNIHGPWGILLDDLVSAGYAAAIMYVIWWAFPSLLGQGTH